MPIIQKLVAVYKCWHDLLPHIPKHDRYTLGLKIDNLLVEIIESLVTASFLDRQRKLPYLQKAALKLDVLKFFLQIGWEIKMVDNKRYVALSRPLNEVGRMLGGWLRQTSNQNPAKEGGA